MENAEDEVRLSRERPTGNGGSFSLTDHSQRVTNGGWKLASDHMIIEDDSPRVSEDSHSVARHNLFVVSESFCVTIEVLRMIRHPPGVARHP
jgi:hypothetical protein